MKGMWGGGVGKILWAQETIVQLWWKSFYRSCVFMNNSIPWIYHPKAPKNNNNWWTIKKNLHQYTCACPTYYIVDNSSSLFVCPYEGRRVWLYSSSFWWISSFVEILKCLWWDFTNEASKMVWSFKPNGEYTKSPHVIDIWQKFSIYMFFSYVLWGLNLPNLGRFKKHAIWNPRLGFIYNVISINNPIGFSIYI
jgi:hypothetical protein